jgi:hypothetical protein
MGMFRRSNSRQTITGIFLLVLLAVFAGPNTLPRLLTSVIPFADEGVPCSWLPTAEGRDQHQSLIGRSAANPISLGVKSSAVPGTQDGKLVISITVVNESIGTIGFLFNPQQVIVGDNQTSGLGLIFNPQNGLSTGGTRQDTGVYPESDIRILGPRQRCVHKVEFPANNSAGQIIQAQTAQTPIFLDQGLWTGFVSSEPAFIPVASQ